MRFFPEGLLIFFAFSCTTAVQQEPVVIDFEHNIENFRPFRLSEIAQDLGYIVLETQDSAKLNDIRFLDVSSGYIAVADENQCLLFNAGGKLISKIGRKGRGPEEYRFISQMKLVNDKVLLPDPVTHKIKSYTLKGDFITEIKTPGEFSPNIHSRNWMPLTDTTFLVRIPNKTGKEPFRIALIDEWGETIRMYRNTSFFNRMEEGYGTTDVAAQFYRLNDSVYYKEMLNDTIWQVAGEELRTAYIINRGKYGFSLKDKELPATVWQKKFTGCVSISYVFECNRFIYLIFDFMAHYPFSFYRKSNSSPDKTPYEIIGMYDKKARDFFLVKPANQNGQIQPTGIENDMDGGIHFMPKYSFDSKLLSWVTAKDMKRFAASEAFKTSFAKFPEKKKELEQLANSLDENDNPVLVVVWLK